MLEVFFLIESKNTLAHLVKVVVKLILKVKDFFPHFLRPFLFSNCRSRIESKNTLAHLVKVDDCFELRLHRFLVCSGMGNHFQYSRRYMRSALQLLGCGLVLRRGLREAGDQVGSSSRRDGLFFFAMASPRFSYKIDVSRRGHRLSRRASPLEEGLASRGGSRLSRRALFLRRGKAGGKNVRG